jgi:hypothetical protein
MKGSLMLGIVLGLATSVAFAQKPQTYRPKKSTNLESRKPAKATPMMKTPNATSDAAKDLRHIEEQSARGTNVKTVGTKAKGGSAGVFKPEKEKPTPPITSNVPGGMGTNTKGLGATNQGKNPYKGRLRQKGSK